MALGSLSSQKGVWLDSQKGAGLEDLEDSVEVWGQVYLLGYCLHLQAQRGGMS